MAPLNKRIPLCVVPTSNVPPIFGIPEIGQNTGGTETYDSDFGLERGQSVARRPAFILFGRRREFHHGIRGVTLRGGRFFVLRRMRNSWDRTSIRFPSPSPDRFSIFPFLSSKTRTLCTSHLRYLRFPFFIVYRATWKGGKTSVRATTW